MGVAGSGGRGHAGAAGVGQAQRAGHLVKGLAGGVVHRAAQHLVPAPVLHHHDMAVPAAGHQAEERRFQFRVGQIIGGNVPPQMVHRHQRLAAGVGQPLGKVDPHQHRADQPRRKGHGHRVHVGHGHVGVGQGFLHRGADIFDVAAAGDLRHHAAVQRLLLDAGADHIGDQRPAVLHDGGRRLVAGRFDSQNIHLSLSPTTLCPRARLFFCYAVMPSFHGGALRSARFPDADKRDAAAGRAFLLKRTG